MESTKKRKQRPTTLSAFTIILIITFILGIISHFLPEATNLSACSTGNSFITT